MKESIMRSLFVGMFVSVVMFGGNVFAQQRPLLPPDWQQAPTAEATTEIEGDFPLLDGGEKEAALRKESCRSVRFRVGATKLPRAKITVMGKNPLTKEVYCALHYTDQCKNRIWPVSDTVYDDLQLGKNGEYCSYVVMLAVGADGRMAIVAVYEGQEVHPRPANAPAPAKSSVPAVPYETLPQSKADPAHRDVPATEEKTPEVPKGKIAKQPTTPRR